MKIVVMTKNDGDDGSGKKVSGGRGLISQWVARNKNIKKKESSEVVLLGLELGRG
jgi:hypothetical protein